MKKYFYPLILAMVICSPAFAQIGNRTIHLNSLLHETEESKAAYTLRLTNMGGTSFKGVIYDYSNTIKADGNYVLVGKKYLEDGHFTYYYQNGQIESEGDYNRGVKVGHWKRFDTSGKRKTDRYYPAENADKIRETMQMEKSDDEK